MVSIEILYGEKKWDYIFCLKIPDILEFNQNKIS